MPSSRARKASGDWVMLMTSHPAERYQFDSARVGQQRRAQLGAVGVGEADVADVGTVVEGVAAARRAVDELVEGDEVAGSDVGLQRACRAGADDALHAEHAHGPEVGPVVDLV